MKPTYGRHTFILGGHVMAGLKAAVERIGQYRHPHRPIPSKEYQSAKFWDAVWMLVDTYLAEHDDTPITEEALRGLGFQTGDPVRQRLYFDDVSVSIWNGKQHDETAICTVPRRGLTLGQLRRLLSVLEGGE